MDEPAPETQGQVTYDVLFGIASGVISRDKNDLYAAAEILMDLGKLAVSIEEQLWKSEARVLSLESDETVDEVAVEIENNRHFALQYALDEIANIACPIYNTDNEGELA
jgi:precorrin isomerase